MPMITAPINVPGIEPIPPEKLVPPTTTAANKRTKSHIASAPW
jgi:hypothetical protein